MTQYLVAIRDTAEVFYRLVDDAEALDELFGVYGVYRDGYNHGVVGCWKMKPPQFDERLGTSDAEGLYPGAEIIPLTERVNAD